MQQEQKGLGLTGIIEWPSDNVIYMPKGKYIAISKKIEDPNKKGQIRQFGHSIKSEEEGFIFRTSSSVTSQNDLMLEIDKLRMNHHNLELKAKSMLKNLNCFLKHDQFFHDMVEVIKPIAKELEVVVDDRSLMENLKSVYPALSISHYTGSENIFSCFQLNGEVEKALKRIVWLSNGAYLVVDEVEALTIMDVNTGKYSGKQDLADTVLKTNLLAAEEAARQIVLRDLAGMILIDFIDMKSEMDRNSVMHTLATELKKDDRQNRIIGFTALGILQLTRKKTKVSVSESLLEKCPVCEGLGQSSKCRNDCLST